MRTSSRGKVRKAHALAHGGRSGATCAAPSASERGLGRGKKPSRLKEVLEISKQIGDRGTLTRRRHRQTHRRFGKRGKYYDLYLDALNDELNV